MKNPFFHSPVLQRLAVIGVSLFAVLLVAITVAYAFTDQTIGASVRLYSGNSSTDVAFIARNNDSVRVQSQLTLNDKVIAGGTKFAKIDSFTTTGALDTVVMSGVSVGDVFSVTPYTPSWSAVQDTGSCQYSAGVLNTDSVLVRRLKLTPASTLKSAAAFSVVCINK